MPRLALFTLLSFLAFSALAESSQTQVNIGCTITAPPYVIKENNRGIILDIMREALANQGIETNFSYANNSQSVKDFSNGDLDALCMTRGTVAPPIYFSTEPLVSFQNSAITLKASHIKLEKISDLSRYRVHGFHMASIMLPKEYLLAVKGSNEYLEQENQAEQVKALVSGEADVVIMGEPIFRFYLSQLRRSDPSNTLLYQKYVFYDLFKAAVYYPAFRSENLRNEYEKGFKLLKESGKLDKIHAEYQLLIDRYFFSTEQ